MAFWPDIDLETTAINREQRRRRRRLNARRMAHTDRDAERRIVNATRTFPWLAPSASVPLAIRAPHLLPKVSKVKADTNTERGNWNWAGQRTTAAPRVPRVPRAIAAPKASPLDFPGQVAPPTAFDNLTNPTLHPSLTLSERLEMEASVNPAKFGPAYEGAVKQVFDNPEKYIAPAYDDYTKSDLSEQLRGGNYDQGTLATAVAAAADPKLRQSYLKSLAVGGGFGFGDVIDALPGIGHVKRAVEGAKAVTEGDWETAAERYLQIGQGGGQGAATMAGGKAQMAAVEAWGQAIPQVRGATRALLLGMQAPMDITNASARYLASGVETLFDSPGRFITGDWTQGDQNPDYDYGPFGGIVGQSPAFIAFEDLLAGREVDLGEGAFPDPFSRVYREAGRRARAASPFLIGGHAWTPGRQIAGEAGNIAFDAALGAILGLRGARGIVARVNAPYTGGGALVGTGGGALAGTAFGIGANVLGDDVFDPDEWGFQLVSGAVDAYITIRYDPTNVFFDRFADRRRLGNVAEGDSSVPSQEARVAATTAQHKFRALQEHETIVQAAEARLAHTVRNAGEDESLAWVAADAQEALDAAVAARDAADAAYRSALRDAGVSIARAERHYAPLEDAKVEHAVPPTHAAEAVDAGLVWTHDELLPPPGRSAGVAGGTVDTTGIDGPGMYHVTTRADEVLREGLKDNATLIRESLKAAGVDDVDDIPVELLGKAAEDNNVALPVGLGLAADEAGVSVYYDPLQARYGEEMLRLSTRAARGELAPEDVLDEFFHIQEAYGTVALADLPSHLRDPATNPFARELSMPDADDALNERYVRAGFGNRAYEEHLQIHDEVTRLGARMGDDPAQTRASADQAVLDAGGDPTLIAHDDWDILRAQIESMVETGSNMNRVMHTLVRGLDEAGAAAGGRPKAMLGATFDEAAAMDPTQIRRFPVAVRRGAGVEYINPAERELRFSNQADLTVLTEDAAARTGLHSKVKRLRDRWFPKQSPWHAFAVTEEGSDVVRMLRELESPTEVWELLGRPQLGQAKNLVSDLAKAQTEAEVRSILTVGFQGYLREFPSVGRYNLRVKTRNAGRGFAQAPNRGLKYNDVPDAVEQGDRWLINMKMDWPERRETLDAMWGAANWAEWYDVTTRVFRRGMDHLIDQEGLPPAVAEELTTAWRKVWQGLQRYGIDDELGENLDSPLAIINDMGVPKASPQLPSEMLSHEVPLPDHRTIRRAMRLTSRHYNKLKGDLSDIEQIIEKQRAALEIVTPGPRQTKLAAELSEKEEAYEKLLEAVNSATYKRELARQMIDGFGGAWRRMKLARGAWGVRVVGEEQFRMWAYGMVGLMNHPFEALAIVAASSVDSKLGKVIEATRNVEQRFWASRPGMMLRPLPLLTPDDVLPKFGDGITAVPDDMSPGDIARLEKLNPAYAADPAWTPHRILLDDGTGPYAEVTYWHKAAQGDTAEKIVVQKMRRVEANPMPPPALGGPGTPPGTPDVGPPGSGPTLGSPASAADNDLFGVADADAAEIMDVLPSGAVDSKSLFRNGEREWSLADPNGRPLAYIEKTGDKSYVISGTDGQQVAEAKSLTEAISMLKGNPQLSQWDSTLATPAPRSSTFTAQIHVGEVAGSRIPGFAADADGYVTATRAELEAMHERAAAFLASPAGDPDDAIVMQTRAAMDSVRSQTERALAKIDAQEALWAHPDLDGLDAAWKRRRTMMPDGKPIPKGQTVYELETPDGMAYIVKQPNGEFDYTVPGMEDKGFRWSSLQSTKEHIRRELAKARQRGFDPQAFQDPALPDLHGLWKTRPVKQGTRWPNSEGFFKADTEVHSIATPYGEFAMWKDPDGVWFIDYPLRQPEWTKMKPVDPHPYRSGKSRQSAEGSVEQTIRNHRASAGPPDNEFAQSGWHESADGTATRALPDTTEGAIRQLDDGSWEWEFREASRADDGPHGPLVIDRGVVATRDEAVRLMDDWEDAFNDAHNEVRIWHAERTQAANDASRKVMEKHGYYGPRENWPEPQVPRKVLNEADRAIKKAEDAYAEKYPEPPWPEPETIVPLRLRMQRENDGEWSLSMREESTPQERASARYEESGDPEAPPSLWDQDIPGENMTPQEAAAIREMVDMDAGEATNRFIASLPPEERMAFNPQGQGQWDLSAPTGGGGAGGGEPPLGGPPAGSGPDPDAGNWQSVRGVTAKGKDRKRGFDELADELHRRHPKVAIAWGRPPKSWSEEYLAARGGELMDGRVDLPMIEKQRTQAFNERTDPARRYIHDILNNAWEGGDFSEAMNQAFSIFYPEAFHGSPADWRKFGQHTKAARGWQILERDHDLFFLAVSEELQRLARDPISNGIAQFDNAEDAVEWLVNGAGREHWRKIARPTARMRFAPSERIRRAYSTLSDGEKRKVAEFYVHSVQRRLQQTTGGDGRLLQAIWDGELALPGRSSKISLIDDDPVGLRHLERELKGLRRGGWEGPKMVRARNTMTEAQKATGRMAEAFDTFFWNLMPRPSNYLSRSPMFRQVYYKRLLEIAPNINEKEYVRLLDNARQAGLTFEELELFRAVTPTTGGGISLRLADELSKTHALSYTRDVLYDLSERGQFFDMFREIFPFGEAWKEVLTRWARAVSENPKVLHRLDQGYRSGKTSGVITNDPISGIETIIYPASEWITKGVASLGLPAALSAGVGAVAGGTVGGMMGGPAGAVAGAALGGVGAGGAAGLLGGFGPEGVLGVPFRGSLSGVNMVSNSLPGVGPIISMPLPFLMNLLGQDLNDPGWKWLNDIVYPYGRPETGDPGVDILEVMLPTFVNKLRDALSERDPTTRSSMGYAMNSLASTGNYELQGPNARDEMERLITDARDYARTVGVLRAVGSFILPSAPMPRYLMEVGEDNKLLEVAIVAGKFQERRAEKGDDYAFDWLMQTFGEDAFLAAQPFTSTQSLLPRTEDGWGFVARHDWLRTTYGEVYGLWVPEDANGVFDLTAYFQSLRREERQYVSPEDRVRLANFRLGSYVYDKAAAKIGPNPNDEQQAALDKLDAALRVEFVGYKEHTPDLESTPRRIREIQAMVDDPRMDEDPHLAKLADTVRTYLDGRDRAQAAAESLGSKTFTSSNATRETRDALRTLAAALIEENPDFAGFWNFVFRRELPQDEADTQTGLTPVEDDPTVTTSSYATGDPKPSKPKKHNPNRPAVPIDNDAPSPLPTLTRALENAKTVQQGRALWSTYAQVHAYLRHTKNSAGRAALFVDVNGRFLVEPDMLEEFGDYRVKKDGTPQYRSVSVRQEPDDRTESGWHWVIRPGAWKDLSVERMKRWFEDSDIWNGPGFEGSGTEPVLPPGDDYGLRGGQPGPGPAGRDEPPETRVQRGADGWAREIALARIRNRTTDNDEEIGEPPSENEVRRGKGFEKIGRVRRVNGHWEYRAPVATIVYHYLPDGSLNPDDPWHAKWSAGPWLPISFGVVSNMAA